VLLSIELFLLEVVVVKFDDHVIERTGRFQAARNLRHSIGGGPTVRFSSELVTSTVTVLPSINPRPSYSTPNMKSFVSVITAILAILASSSNALGFAPPALRSCSSSMRLASASGGSAFVVSQRPQVHNSGGGQPPRRSSPGALSMGSMAKFGVFSPAVYAAKIVLGQDKLNKIRGKAISLHSQSITDFTEWVGAYHLRTKLIKKAKQNGDTLGFLV
jgi:hypothetical protein